MSRKSPAAATHRADPASSSQSGGGTVGTVGSTLYRWARLLLAVACGVALYMSYVSYAGGGIAGCGAEGGCNEVLNSRWSKFLGVPVSLPAAGLYVALIVLSFRLGAGSAAATAASGLLSPRFLLRVGAWSVLGAALWFLFLSAVVLGKFCPYCLTVHLLGATGSVLLLRGLSAEAWRSDPTGASANGWFQYAPWALVPMGVLIGGQLAFAPKTFRVSAVPNAAPVASTPAPGDVKAAPTPAAAPVVAPAPTPPVADVKPPTAPATPPPAVATSAPAPAVDVPAAKPGGPRLHPVHSGKYQLNVEQLPLLGSPTAPQVMVSMFDYTCEHCRRSHAPITQVQQYFSNQLAIISLPMPLDARCNEWIPRTSSAQANGCQFAALALAVWRADKAKFREFDDWMMTSPEGLKVPLALARARQTVGEAALNEALADPWVANTLQLSIAIYRDNWLSIKSSSMPMLIVGGNIVSGTVPSAKDLFRLVETSLGLKASP